MIKFFIYWYYEYYLYFNRFMIIIGVDWYVLDVFFMLEVLFVKINLCDLTILKICIFLKLKYQIIVNLYQNYSECFNNDDKNVIEIIDIKALSVIWTYLSMILLFWLIKF